MEIWKDIKGYEGTYQISNLGSVKSFIGKTKILKNSKPIKRKDGNYSYPKVQLKGKTYRIHRLVALAFIPNPENKSEVNHKDKNINNNTLDNLEWCTEYENRIHKLGLPNMEIFSKQIKKHIMELIPL